MVKFGIFTRIFNLLDKSQNLEIIKLKILFSKKFKEYIINFIKYFIKMEKYFCKKINPSDK